MKRIIIYALFAMASVTAFAQTKGFEKAVEATGGIGLDKYQKFSFGVNLVGGYRINDHFFVGAGAGYEYLDGLYYTSYEYHSGAGNSYHGTSDDPEGQPHRNQGLTVLCCGSGCQLQSQFQRD